MVKDYFIKPFSLFNVNGKDEWYILHNDGLNDKVLTIPAPQEKEILSRTKIFLSEEEAR